MISTQWTRSAQLLADQEQEPTYIVQRHATEWPDDGDHLVILFAHEFTPSDVAHVLHGFAPSTTR